jgi:hypothetical protein
MPSKVLVRVSGAGGEGLELTVTPLSQALRRRLIELAIEQYPDPDATKYQKSRTELGLPPAFGDEPDVLRGEDTAEYRAAAAAIQASRQQLVTDAAFDVCVQHPDKERLLKAYQAERAALRANGISTHVRDWAETLRYFLCTEAEWAAIIQIIAGQAPLTEEEVRDGMTFFRLDVSEYVRRAVAAFQGASSSTKDEPDTQQSADGRDDRSEELGLSA